jgi:hypothetical protein
MTGPICAGALNSKLRRSQVSADITIGQSCPPCGKRIRPATGVRHRGLRRKGSAHCSATANSSRIVATAAGCRALSRALSEILDRSFSLTHFPQKLHFEPVCAVYRYSGPTAERSSTASRRFRLSLLARGLLRFNIQPPLQRGHRAAGCLAETRPVFLTTPPVCLHRAADRDLVQARDHVIEFKFSPISRLRDPCMSGASAEKFKCCVVSRPLAMLPECRWLLRSWWAAKLTLRSFS